MIKLNPLTGDFDDVGFPARTITGTTNQITVTNGDGVSGNPTLSLPQDIHTGASPTYTNVNVGNFLTVNRTAVGNAGVEWKIAGNNRFRLLTTTTAESGSNAGSDLALYSYNDAGAFLGTPLTITRSSGQITLGYNINTRTLVSTADSTYDIGSPSIYYANTYTDRLYLNSTAYLDGGTAGVASLTGKLNVTGVQAIYVPDQTNFAGGMFLGNGGGSLSHASGDEGQFNTGVGVDALLSVTTGNYNTAIGRALRSNTTGANNASIGAFSLGANTTGGGNMAIGTYALGTNVNGYNNIAIGASALYNSKGYYNTAIGASAGFTKPSGDGCVFIGYRSGYYETGSNKLFIDNTQRASEADGRVKALVYGVFAATTAAQTLTVNGVLNTSEEIQVDGTKVVGNRVIDARCDDAINSGDATTDGVIDALRDAMIAHGLIAAA